MLGTCIIAAAHYRKPSITIFDSIINSAIFQACPKIIWVPGSAFGGPGHYCVTCRTPAPNGTSHA
jgi:hypothetical protein